MSTVKAAVAGGIAGAFIVAGTAALAGTGVGGVFNLGQSNTVNVPTKLSGMTAGPQLQVSNSSDDDPSIVATAESGPGVALSGEHTGKIGTGAAVRGESAAPYAPGVLGVNTAGGPGLSAIVNPGSAPLRVNSATKVAKLNADLLDGKSSTGFLSSSGSLDVWTSPFEYHSPQLVVRVDPAYGPDSKVTSSTAGPRDLFLALNTPALPGATFKLQKVTICFSFAGAAIVGTALLYGDATQTTELYHDSYLHTSPTPTCYDIAPSSPTAITGMAWIHLNVNFGSSSDYLDLYPVKATFGT